VHDAALVEDVRRRLAGAADPDRAPAMQAYMKSAMPFHGVPSPVARENPFIRIWRGLEQPAERPCTAFGQPATLLLRAQDYDGGTKCWVRFDEGQKLDIVPGSQVRTLGP
jgi:hypothetical protein